jgi:ubiquinone/menaquinone biosynthesis C-methylase UbiE
MPSPDLYFDTIFAFQRSAALKTAIDLDLFSAIAETAGETAAIAARCNAPERAVRILCDYLTTLGFLTKSGAAYVLTEDSAVFLTRSSPAYVGATAEFLHSAALRDAFAELTHTVRCGSPSDSVLVPDHPQWVRFARAMLPMMMPTAHEIADLLHIEESGPVKVLDIAAGHGIFGIVLAQRNPQAQITAVDWARVLHVASENARVMGVASRHRTLGGDALGMEFARDFDIALVTNFLHHFDRATCVAFLKKTADALRPGGRVAILEFVPNADRASPPMPVRFAITMLATTPDGDAYTYGELDDMLREAGFADTRAHALRGPQTLIVATTQ